MGLWVAEIGLCEKGRERKRGRLCCDKEEVNMLVLLEEDTAVVGCGEGLGPCILREGKMGEEKGEDMGLADRLWA